MGAVTGAGMGSPAQPVVNIKDVPELEKLWALISPIIREIDYQEGALIECLAPNVIPLGSKGKRQFYLGRDGSFWTVTRPHQSYGLNSLGLLNLLGLKDISALGELIKMAVLRRLVEAQSKSPHRMRTISEASLNIALWQQPKE